MIYDNCASRSKIGDLEMWGGGGRGGAYPIFGKGTVLGKKKEGMENRGWKRLEDKWQRDYRNENNDQEQEVRKRKGFLK